MWLFLSSLLNLKIFLLCVLQVEPQVRIYSDASPLKEPPHAASLHKNKEILRIQM